MEFKGTQGEWKVLSSSKHETRICTATYRIADVKHFQHKVTETHEEPSTKEGQANAHLIASAPELLEALQLCQNFLKVIQPSMSHSNDWSGAIKAGIELNEKAINKAIING